jgi:hypothetical protein
LFRDTLHIGLYADRVVLVRVSGGLRARSTEQITERVPAGGHAASAAAILDVLQQLLKEPRWQGADAQVQLSNALVYYALVPASAQLLGAADEIALAQLKFRQMHGAGGAACEVRLGNLLSGQDQIAAALDSGFVERLRQLLLVADLRLCSLEPLLMRAFNRVRRQLAGDDFWFALAEPGLLMLARRQGGNWVSLAATALHEPLARSLPAQLQEARLMGAAGPDVSRVYLYAPGMDCTGCESRPDMDLVKLTDRKNLDPLTAAQARGFALEALK